jgi:hypothetical protein
MYVRKYVGYAQNITYLEMLEGRAMCCVHRL